MNLIITNTHPTCRNESTQTEDVNAKKENNAMKNVEAISLRMNLCTF